MGFTIHCPACGYEIHFREGIRFCAACAANVTIPCYRCHEQNFVGDRYCAFCAAPVTLHGAPAPGAPEAAAAPAAPAHPAGNSMQEEFLALAMRARQSAVDTPAEAKIELKGPVTQADIDNLFS